MIQINERKGYGRIKTIIILEFENTTSNTKTCCYHWEKRKKYMSDESNIPITSLYPQNLRLLLILQMQCFSRRECFCRWLQVNDKNDKRYKLLQLHFDVNTLIYCLGTNIVYSFSLLRNWHTSIKKMFFSFNIFSLLMASCLSWHPHFNHISLLGFNIL